MDALILYTSCGPWVHPQTLAAVIAVESRGYPWAIGTADGSLYAPTLELAKASLRYALATHSSVDIGLMQINSQWVQRLNLDPERLLDPCINVRIGAAILANNFVHVSRPGRTHLEALVAALSMYNSGSETASLRYAKKVLQAPFSTMEGKGTKTIETQSLNAEERAIVSPLTFPEPVPKLP